MTPQELDDIERELYKSSLYHFTKYCLGYSKLHTRVHGPICSELQSKITRRKLICIPRGCFKSSIASVAYPLWLIIQNPDITILLDSELYSNSKNFLREIKGHITRNEKFIHLFGELIGDTWNESEIIVSTRKRNIKEPTIACSGIGAQKTSQHYDIIIADDLCSRKNTQSKELAQKVIDHYRMYTSLLHTDGTIVVIGTRYSELDVIQYILDTEVEDERKENIWQISSKLSGSNN